MSATKQIIHLIAAARPNFMKVAPLYHQLAATGWGTPVIVHTGQHYDLNMSDAFFRDLGLPEPHIHLGAGTGSHAEQTARVMMAYEKSLLDTCPDMTVVVGDVNSTLACTLAAVKLAYPAANAHGRTRPVIAHLEAGLRSFDRSMPEEVNRMVTDTLADVLWTPSPDADQNLLNEGIAASRIQHVGNIMIDSLEMMRGQIEGICLADDLGLRKGGYAIATFHRPGNVDDPQKLAGLCDLLIDVSSRLPVVFPVHPRTQKQLQAANLLDRLERAPAVILLEPQSYIRFMSLVFDCRLVLTDSGGIQEETTYLGVPCLTLRPNTERPVTVSAGTNRLCAMDNVRDELEKVLTDACTNATPPALWDGRTAQRVVARIHDILGVGSPA